MTALLLDTETTGLEQPRIVEAAWLILDSPLDVTPPRQFLQRYHPGKPIEPAALALHHIRDPDVAGCPPDSDFQLPAGVRYLVGYHVDYDWRLIGEPPLRRICVLALARFCFPGLHSYSQSAVLRHVAGDEAHQLLQHAHSAMQDAENCRLILQQILRHLRPRSATWTAVWRRSQQARIPAIMPFGKYKGKPIHDLPAHYKRWLLSQQDLDPYLAAALRGL